MSSPGVSDLFARGGEMGWRMRGHDWPATPLGEAAGWPQNLRSALSICLDSSFPIAIYWGPQLALLYNDAWSPILGTRHPWALGRAGREVWPEIWDTIGPLFDHVMSRGEATYSEDQLLPLRRHGYTEECYFNYTFSPIRGEGGRVEGVFNAVIETTFRVIAERRTQVLHELGDRVSGARSAREACATAARVLGAADRDVPFGLLYLVEPGSEDARLTEAIHLVRGSTAAPERVELAGGARPASGWPLGSVAATGQLEQIDNLTERFGQELPGGAWPEAAPAALVAPLLTGPRGRVGAFLVAGTSPRRAIDDEYRRFIGEAASQVAMAIANAEALDEMDRLRRAAESASRAKDEFLAMLGHELRNPLAPIMTALQLMRLRGDDRLERERDVIERQVTHLTRLVDDLLDVSRIARGKVELKKEPTEIAQIVAKAIEQASPLLEQRTHLLELDVPRAGLLVDADATRLAQVISNLLTNAAKYTEAGGQILISARRDVAAVVVSVRDTGIGISPEMLPRIFDLFAQETQAADRAQGGLGLGLTIVRNLVDLHGGVVWASSEGVGKGSRFDIRLPALHVPVRAAAPGAASAPAGPTRNALKVLVVDDNRDAAEMLAEVLRSLGHQTRAAHDGPAALRECLDFTPDVALLDIGLPVMDGYELAQRIRELPGLDRVRLVAVTGYGQESDRERSRTSGFHHHLVKPIDIDVIDTVVRAMEPSV